MQGGRALLDARQRLGFGDVLVDEALLLHFREAVEAGEIRGDIPLGTLFRLVIGSLRLLIKQWGLSNGSFDLTQKRLELQESLRKLLSRQ